MRLAPAALALVSLVALMQDPRPAGDPDPTRAIRAPVGADPLPPVPDPPATVLERRDLATAFLPPTGYEGFYRLVGIASQGRVLREGMSGYLAIGRGHLAIHVVRAGPPGQPPLVQSGFRTYRVEGGSLVTTALAGHDNFDGGKLRFERPGLVERRQLVRTPAALRVVRDEGAWMEFVRLE